MTVAELHTLLRQYPEETLVVLPVGDPERDRFGTISDHGKWLYEERARTIHPVEEGHPGTSACLVLWPED